MNDHLRDLPELSEIELYRLAEHHLAEVYRLLDELDRRNGRHRDTRQPERPVLRVLQGGHK